MKQLVQNTASGFVNVETVPAPILQGEGILVRTEVSLISAGTERMVLKAVQQSPLAKARQKPDFVRRALQKLRRDGFLKTFQSVRRRLDRDLPLGYSLAGLAVDIGSRVRDLQCGQRVACAGAGFASHAELNYIPRMLAVATPPGVSDEAAAYTTVGAIALQGVRNAELRVGETVVVVGLGLIGQLAVQVAQASGCRVIGIDVAADRVELAHHCGAALAIPLSDEKLDQAVSHFTRGRGADAVLITASTASNAPIEVAARLARDRARVVMVGVTGMQVPREPYYHKELTLIVSRSYGPGRYDADYELKGHDYPVGYVRWTENRNLEAFLDLVASGSVTPERLTTHRFAIDDAQAAFELILGAPEPHLGVLLTYPKISLEDPLIDRSPVRLRAEGHAKTIEKLGVSFIGAGSFARAVLLPRLAKMTDVELRGVITSSGLSARAVGKDFHFGYCGTDVTNVLEDQDNDVVFVLTRHAQHADTVCRSLRAGKTVFVEKPLAVSLEQLRDIRRVLDEINGRLMVGFNRRFAPLAIKVKACVSGLGPLMVQYRCNAGPIEVGHWLHDPTEGGRIIGEACHFFDFFAFLTDSRPNRVHSTCPKGHQPMNDGAISVEYEDGSVCQLIYTTSGQPMLGKERMEVYAAGNTAVLEDFQTLHWHSSNGKYHEQKLVETDKGHDEELRQFVAAVRNTSPMPIGLESIFDTTLASFAAVTSAVERRSVELDSLRKELANR